MWTFIASCLAPARANRARRSRPGLGLDTVAPPAPLLGLAQRADLPRLQRFVALLSVHTRVQRFFFPARELPRALVHAIERADEDHVFVLAEHKGEVVGLGQYAAERSGARCEIALVVADAWQGCGLGGRLLARVLENASQRGLREAILETKATNGAMQSLARRAGFTLLPHPEDDDLVVGRLSLAAA
jgi:acetyltransferase